MVCQKTDDSTHDFLHDPIRCVRDGDWLRADRTTLGADNGIAIALMMVLTENVAAAHPPLELLLTVSEEQGVVGADNLDPALVTGKTLLNLDSEKEGIFTIGCAGGVSVNINLPVSREVSKDDDTVFKVKVDGLQGGHSAEDINKRRANANILLARILDDLGLACGIQLSTLSGGTVRNAIPRKAVSIFACPAHQSLACRTTFKAIAAEVLAEYRDDEPTVSIEMQELEGRPIEVISHSQSMVAIQLLVSLPNGVASMSREVPGFVETSNNLGVVELDEDTLLIVSSNRSVVFSRIEEITRRIEALASLAGAGSKRTRMFPPWKPSAASLLLDACLAAYRTSTGIDGRVELAHGGLECGIISDRCGGMDAVSMGPNMEGLHSPDERLSIPSLSRTWDFLVTLLASL
jgi:dipeptidase D